MLKLIYKLCVKRFTARHVKEWWIDPDERVYIKKIKGNCYAYARKRNKHKIANRYYDRYIGACDIDGYLLSHDGYMKKGY